jgi:hypothetical protein
MIKRNKYIILFVLLNSEFSKYWVKPQLKKTSPNATFIKLTP